MEKVFYDEAFIALRNSQAQYEEDLAYEEEEGIACEVRSVEEKILLSMPKSFEPMDDKLIEIKYPAYKSPNKCIYTNEDTTINLILDFKTLEVAEEELPKVRDSLLEILLKLHPTSPVTDKGVLESEVSQVAYFELVTPSLDKPIYNFMFFFQLEGKLVTGTFNCFKTEADIGGKMIREMIPTLKNIKKQEVS